MCGRGYHLGPFVTVVTKHACGTMTKTGCRCRACDKTLTDEERVTGLRLRTQVVNVLAKAMSHIPKEKT